MDLETFNHLARPDAARTLAACCGSGRWIDRMVQRRPYRDSTALLMTAEEAWWDLGTEDWREALAGHPNDDEAFMARFGHPYVVYANGRSVEDLEAIRGERLASDPMAELQVAATEQARITNRRLRDLFELD